MLPRHLLIRGDSRTLPLASNSVDCCVTSPPYFGLRSYHDQGSAHELGRERTSEEYIAKLVVVFEQVRRVLRPRGTLWLNLGDSFNAYNGNRGVSQNGYSGNGGRQQLPVGYGLVDPTRKNKDRLGIPWRVALALQAAGWHLRMDVVWFKNNCMPESVRDRPVAAHEYLFLLSKSQRYHYETIKEPAVCKHPSGNGYKRDCRLSFRDKRGVRGNDRQWTPTALRTKRSVWTVPTRRGYGGHKATFPPELVTDCVRAGCPPGGWVLDPFAGSFTVAAVAHQLGRNSIGVELYREYLSLGRERLLQLPPLSQV